MQRIFNNFKRIMNYSIRKLLLLAVFAASGTMASAQLPNEKFGKPSKLEWDFAGWGEATKADAIILSKTMTVTYKLTDQVSNNNMTDIEVNWGNIDDFGKNQIDESSILVNFEVRLRTKILKPEGARHANIDITYYCADDGNVYNSDNLSDLKVRVFTRNAKGKVEKRNVNTDGFAQERVDANYVVTHVKVPDVEAGSIIEYQYNITSTRAAFLYDWVFQECIPTVRSKCDIEVPAFLQFNMNTPINKLVKSSVEVGRLAYDVNRTDMKKGKTCPTNHYKIVGDYILPEDKEIANFTSQIAMPHVTVPAKMPEGHTHLKIEN